MVVPIINVITLYRQLVFHWPIWEKKIKMACQGYFVWHPGWIPVFTFWKYWLTVSYADLHEIDGIDMALMCLAFGLGFILTLVHEDRSWFTCPDIDEILIALSNVKLLFHIHLQIPFWLLLQDQLIFRLQHSGRKSSGTILGGNLIFESGLEIEFVAC